MAPLNGQRGAFEQPPRWGRNQSGQFYTRVFEGTLNEMRAKAGSFDAQGYFYEVTEGYEKAHLEVQLDYNPLTGSGGTPVELPVDTWEYVGGKAEKDILEADVFTGITATLSQKNIEIIRSAIQNAPDGSDTTGNYSAKDRPQASVAQACFTDGNAANAFTMYKLMQAGVKSAIVRTPTLRHTQTVSNSWTIPASLTNVGRIISTSTITALEGVPSGLLFNLPNVVPATFQTIAVKYGWLKHDPTIQQIAGRKWQLVQEWEYGLWPTATFGQPL